MGFTFFTENYQLTTEEIYDFVLGCSENTALIEQFKKNRHEEAIAAFDRFKKDYYNNE